MLVMIVNILFAMYNLFPFGDYRTKQITVNISPQSNIHGFIQWYSYNSYCRTTTRDESEEGFL